MNLLKKTLTVGLLAAALPGMASAQTILHISGSTAFRSPVDAAIVNYLNSSNTPNKAKAAWSGSNVIKNNIGIYADGSVTFSGSTFTGTAKTIILTNWTGSLAGVVDLVAQNSSLLFLDPANATVETALNGDTITVTGTAITDTGTSVSTTGTTKAAATDVAMSDSFQSSVASALSSAALTGQPGTVTVSPQTGAGLSSLVKNAPLAEAGSASPIVGGGTGAGYLGIVPFEWVLGNITGTGNETAIPFTNITLQTADFLINKGFAPFTMFSAFNTASTANDPTKFVYLVGRNEDSGTRIDAFAEPLLGFIANPQQYRLAFTGGSNTANVPAPTDYTQIGGSGGLVTGMQAWPSNATLNTEPSINWSAAGGGHGGYAAGGDVASVLGTVVSQGPLGTNGSGFAGENSGNTYFIGYLGISDAGNFVIPASTVPGGSNSPSGVVGGTSLSYNGVPYSSAAVLSGAYSFWSYEHMYYLASGGNKIAADRQGVADSLANSIASTFAAYNSSGNPGQANAAGIILPVTNAAGSVTRSVEGGNFSLNY